MTRIGVVGTENSHVDHFIRFLNVENRHPDFTVTALAGGDSERNRTLAEAGQIDTIVETSADLVGQVDAAIISSRDGGLHAEQALPLIKAGIPVLVDKPLAASVEDSIAMLDAADESGKVLLSASAVRYTPEIPGLRDSSDSRGDTRFISVVGAADPDSEYAGLFFYGIHVVETALELTGDGEFGPVSVSRNDGSITATTQINDIDVAMTFVLKDDSGQVPFHATVVGRHGIDSTPLTLSKDYNAPVLQQFTEAVTSGQAPLSRTELLRPVELLDAIVSKL